MTDRIMVALQERENSWLDRHAGLVAWVITFLGFLARLWAASGTFLNPDEALHFRLANQASLGLAYRMSLTASHPPLLTVVLYYWRALGTSEVWLRMPSVLAGVAFCWMFYKWLSKAAGELTGLAGLVLVAFLPPVVLLSAEVRQYSLLLAFLASALYCLDEAFNKDSAAFMVAFSVFLYLALLSHYSAFLFAAALGVYALIRAMRERLAVKVIAIWAIGQLGALVLGIVLYQTHISKLGVGESRTALQGWMSEFFLRHSYFDASHDNRITFLAGHTFGVFQYFFGQLVVGDVMGLLFAGGTAMLLRGKSSRRDADSARYLGIFVLLLFLVAACASLTHVYPYGGTRHVAFLIIPGIAGVSTAIVSLAGQKRGRGIAIAALVVVMCVALGKPRRPRMDRADQSRTHMMAAMNFVKQNIGSSDLIFTDYESDLILGHYLCEQRPIVFEPSSADFEVFSCGHRIVSASYKSATLFSASNFLGVWERLVETYGLKPGTQVWVVQAGWEADLPENLQRDFTEFRDLRFEAFGKNIKAFKMTVGQAMPAASH